MGVGVGSHRPAREHARAAMCQIHVAKEVTPSAVVGEIDNLYEERNKWWQVGRWVGEAVGVGVDLSGCRSIGV